jgi:hypothetical protein
MSVPPPASQVSQVSRGPLVPSAPAAPAGPGVSASASQREEAEWRTLSGQWRDSLTKLLNTIDTVNKKRYELDRQKELLRTALTQGKFDVIRREKALALYNEWNRGIQMIPIYPEDYSSKEESVYLNPLSGADGPERQKVRSGWYLYDLPLRDWIHVAPPDLLTFSDLSAAPDPTLATVIAPPNIPGVEPVVLAPSGVPMQYSTTGVAGWRVRRLDEGETLSFDDIVEIGTERDATIDESMAAANAIAHAASNINKKRLSNPQIVNQTVHEMLRGTSEINPYVDGYQFKFRYHPLGAAQSAAITTPMVYSNALAFEPVVGTGVGTRVVPRFASPPMVPEWRARQQQAAIANQYQRIYFPQEIPSTYTFTPQAF